MSQNPVESGPQQDEAAVSASLSAEVVAIVCQGEGHRRPPPLQVLGQKTWRP